MIKCGEHKIKVLPYTETHFGKFIVRARGSKAIKEYCNEHKIPYYVYNEDDEDINLEGWDKERKYDIIYKFQDDVKPYEPILIEYLEHKTFGDENPDFSYFKHNKDGSVSFAIQFYNGGTCEQEVLGNFENDDSEEFTIL